MRKLFIIIALMAFAGTLMFQGPQYLLKRNLLLFLAAHGFTETTIGSTDIGRGHAIFKNIKLDSEGLSNIEQIDIAFSRTALLFGAPFPTIEIQNINLSGKYSLRRGLEISGWDNQNLLSPGKHYKRLIINKLTVSLSTGAGLLTLKGKGQFVNTPSEAGDKLQYRLNIAATDPWFQINTQWKGNVRQDIQKGASWDLDIDIQSGKMAVKSFASTRLSGWLNFNHPTTTSTTHYSGQLNAGSINIAGLGLTNATLIISHEGKKQNYIFQSQASGYKTVDFVSEISLTGKNDRALLDIGFNSTDPESFLSFTKAFQTMLLKEPFLASNVKKPLISQMDNKNVRRKIQPLDNIENLRLQLSGTLDDLTGKITVNRGNNGQQVDVISLD